MKSKMLPPTKQLKLYAIYAKAIYHNMKLIRDAFNSVMKDITPSRYHDTITITPHIKKIVPSIMGRILAKPIIAEITMPQANVSSMDGFAVRAVDIKTIPTTLRIIGESHAGKPCNAALKKHQAIKIFTGGIIPKNANSVIIVEHTEQKNNFVIIKKIPTKQNFIRPRGLDFKKGDILIKKNHIITARGIALIIASGQKKIILYRQPTIGILSTGNELQPINKNLTPQQIYPSNSYSLFALINHSGGQAIDLGYARDNPTNIAKKLKHAKHCDFIVTTGGASIGEKDFIKEVIENKKYGLKGQINFWKIAMRPGKPIIVGRLHKNRCHFLGLPGNPTSALVTGLLFIPAMIKKWQGLKPIFLDDITIPMPLAINLSANGERQEYMRAKIINQKIMPLPHQDSSMLKFLYDSNALIIRPINDPKKHIGDMVQVLPLNPFYLY
ncbi:MAG: molybdopterin molybdotransferase MoeA [Alphaproteobacteria bacterium]